MGNRTPQVPTPARAHCPPPDSGAEPAEQPTKRQLFNKSAIEAIDLEKESLELDGYPKGLEDGVPEPEEVFDGCIPRIDDRKANANMPKAGQLQLSQSAVNSRLRRVFTPTLSGKLKVSSSIMNDWNAGPKSKKRQQLEQIFQMCGFDVESWLSCSSIVRNSNFDTPCLEAPFKNRPR